MNSAQTKLLLPLFMVLLFSTFSRAQTSNYEDLWAKVEQFEVDGLPKSALKIVEDIEAQATKEKNHPQLIKTLLFKSKFALVLEEDAQLKIINDFKAAIAKSEFPTKNIMESILANLYWQYFNQNRWKFYNRTKTEEKVDPVDFRTWDLQTLFDEVHLRYQKSLENGLMLQQESLSKYDALLRQEKDSKVYRPTLFDFLSHNALDFYKTNETHITKPAYKFEIDNPNFLADAETFSTLKIESKDTTSLQLNALKIYKGLIRFHLNDTSPFALADVNIQRLKFVNEHATFPDKEALLLKSLKTESDRLKTHEASGLYNFEIASAYYGQSLLYTPKKNEGSRWKAKDAMAICNSVISKFPKGKGAEKCKVLKSQIEQQTLQITSEAFLSIQKNARLLIRYKNLDFLQFKIYKLSAKQLAKFGIIYKKDEQWDFIQKLDASKTWDSKLKNETDFQRHSTEILVPKLDNGRYLVVATTKEKDEKTFAFARVQVTDMAVVETETPRHKIFQIINRNDGTPVKNANISMTYYPRGSRVKTTKEHISNNLGEIKIPKDNSWYRNINLTVKNGNDVAYFGDYYLNQHYKAPKQKPHYKSFLFTDRSIYRPGQTVYFKAIAIKTDNGKSEVMANRNVFAALNNVNGEEVKKLELKTNEYGSVSGEFILPNDGLNGQYHIEFDTESGQRGMHSSTYFSVEEYKRPKFEVKLNPVTETFKINDSVTVKGNAFAYAGSNITDAKVVYRVHRKVQYPRWYFWYRPWVNSEPQEIAHSETTTNGKGEFEITFKALPDQSVDKNSLPIFNYEITADITDLNGETRSATTIVKVGYHSLTANMKIDAILDKTQKDHTITIETKNLNGEFVPAKGTVKIYKLKAPNAVLRPRPWEAPDYQEFSKVTFKSLFPYDAYENEHLAENWQKGDLVFEKNFDTKTSKTIALGKIKKWASGQYIIFLESKDRYGQNVKDEIKTTLYSNKDSILADKQLFSITTDKSEYKAGDTAFVTLASSAENLSVTLSVEKDKKIVRTEIVTLNADKKTISIPVNNEDLGGFAIHYSFAFSNSFQSEYTNIAVPYPKTDLEIETLTFRDKLQPGTDEAWEFKIKGPHGEKVSAELLASMYDASLDQFKGHQWRFKPQYKPTYHPHNRSNANRSFGTQAFRVHQNRLHINYPKLRYDRLNWFGFGINNNRWTYQSYLNRLRYKHEAKYKAKYDKSIKKGLVSGVVTDEDGVPLLGANIVVKGTAKGTTTDFDGTFTIKANSEETLSISYVGFVSQEIKIGKNNHFKVFLIADSASLDEVVVVGFGSQKKERFVGATLRTAEAMIVEEAEAEADFTLSKEEMKEQSNAVPDEEANKDAGSSEETEKPDFDNIKIRKNLQETAFFFPQLKTDENGHVSFSFTTPEALTQWKLQLLAYTKTLESATKTLTAVTQKELMVIPNAPRFLREGDKITISTKIANLSEKDISGETKLILTDAISGEDITSALVRSSAVETFFVKKDNNTQTSWQLDIPNDVQVVQYKILAKSGDFSDGEQNALPVLSNRMLVTETLPLWVRSNQTRTFTLDKLKANTSTTLKNHKLTLEMTSNPAWYAVQALPYLMEYPYECNEQTFSRYYANALASYIANSNPRIQEVFNQWRNTDALLSNLEKNQEIKSILIQETPWLRDAKNETEQKKRIALLFDLNKMNNELQSALRKLKNNQMASGAWPWFKGGYENRYITQHIIAGFGHLKRLGVGTEADSNMIKNAINYLDAQFVKEYRDLRKYNAKMDLSKDHLSHTQLHYLYMRSFFPQIKKSGEVERIIDYYQTQIQKYWLERSLYSKGLMALVSYRNDDTATADKILKSLRENSIVSEELGMYWKANTSSWHWYQAPIETQALMIEAFAEIENDTQTIDNLKIWLLKNKQTNRWKTTKATTEAVYALLLQGSDWLSVTDMVDVVLGGQKIEPKKLESVKVEAGTGYFKTAWNPSEITPEMGDVKITKKGKGIAWGGLYWQYFENLDKITFAETPLKLKKKLFLKRNTDKGEEILEITDKTHLKVGDLVRVRIELRSDRAMEFVHMKDMRASGLEPVNVISRYKWQDGLGYYESTKDASTNFFFDYLPKGVFVFEYDLRVNNAGDMSNGITTIQSMYAPEFSSHSKGVRVLAE